MRVLYSPNWLVLIARNFPVPICIIHFGVVSWKVNIPSGPGSMSEKIKRIDFLGALSMVSAVSLLLVGLSMGGKLISSCDFSKDRRRELSEGLVRQAINAHGTILSSTAVSSQEVSSS